MTYIQTISSQPSPNYASSLFIEKISPAVTDRLKRIGVIALAVIVSLVTCCAAILHWKQKRKLKDLTSIKEHYQSIKLGKQEFESSRETAVDVAAEIQNFFQEIPTLDNPFGIEKETPNHHVLQRLQEIKELLDHPKVNKQAVFREIALSLAESKLPYYYRVIHLNTVVESFRKNLSEQKSS